MRKTHRFCFSQEFLERKLSLSTIDYSPAPALVQDTMMADGPTTPPPTDPLPTDPSAPAPAPGDPGSPTDPYLIG